MKRLSIALGLAAISIGLAAPSATPATAVANPDCGNMRWRGQTYWFSAGGVSCQRGRVLMRRYLDHNTAPAGYRCSKRYAPSCWHRTQHGTFLKLTTPH